MFIKNFFDTWLIPENVKNDPYKYRKAVVLTYLHLLILIISISAIIAAYTINPENKKLPLIPGTLSMLFLMFVFRKFGNLLLSGNLLAALYFIVIAPIVPETGALYSDNLLWLIITPLIALLFGNKKYGVIWLASLLIFIFFIYKTTPYDISKYLVSDNSYYLTSYIFLFLAIYGVVYIFEGGQDLIIKMLNRQKAVLEQKNNEIEQKNAELQALEEKLRATNQELENFAYAASHDLKEPLRMIKMYTQLTQKRLGSALDTNAMEYMGYVTDGTSRMQSLLDDLLQYSRLGKKKDDIKDVDLNNIIFVVVHNLTATLKDTEAAIVVNKLPVITCNSTEMIQLFQNLISNSLKFRKKDVPPKIEIRAKDDGENYLITLEDNGIGIKEEYHQKVFNIFERLHTRNEYEGSGIGLATVKKIVHSAGGKIWLSSTEGVGTTFYFTFPKPCAN